MIIIIPNHHDIFEWLNYFQMITMFLNDYNIFEWLQLLTCDTIFMKITKSINSII